CNRTGRRPARVLSPGEGARREEPSRTGLPALLVVGVHGASSGHERFRFRSRRSPAAVVVPRAGRDGGRRGALGSLSRWPASDAAPHPAALILSESRGPWPHPGPCISGLSHPDASTREVSSWLDVVRWCSFYRCWWAVPPSIRARASATSSARSRP